MGVNIDRIIVATEKRLLRATCSLQLTLSICFDYLPKQRGHSSREQALRFKDLFYNLVSTNKKTQTKSIHMLFYC